MRLVNINKLIVFHNEIRDLVFHLASMISKLINLCLRIRDIGGKVSEQIFL